MTVRNGRYLALVPIKVGQINVNLDTYKSINRNKIGMIKMNVRDKCEMQQHSFVNTGLNRRGRLGEYERQEKKSEEDDFKAF